MTAPSLSMRRSALATSSMTWRTPSCFRCEPLVWGLGNELVCGGQPWQSTEAGGGVSPPPPVDCLATY